MKTPDATKNPTGLSLYTRAAELSSNEIIRAYSTSFGMAVSLLHQSVRQDVRNIYALVRVADEIVDGAAAEALGAKAKSGKVSPLRLLDELENQVYESLQSGFSSNLVVHAFALTARKVGFGKELIEPFFFSMRQDLNVQVHDQKSFERYVYGSAEVVGLMCLAAFVYHDSKTYSKSELQKLEAGARALGSAFQKVNFLRDLAADFKKLGRSYFPNVTVASFNENQKIALVADIETDLVVARDSIANLPSNSRAAVAAATRLFAELNQRIDATAASELITKRISVPNLIKIRLLLAAIITKRG